MLRRLFLLFVLCHHLYAESCGKIVSKKFRNCLEDGYESELCPSSGSTEMSDAQISSCQKVENKVKKCDFDCPTAKPEWREFTTLKTEARLVNGDETEVKFDCLKHAVFTISYGNNLGNDNFIHVNHDPKAYGMIRMEFCGFRQNVNLYPNSNTLKCKNGVTTVKISRKEKEISIKSKSGDLLKRNIGSDLSCSKSFTRVVVHNRISEVPISLHAIYA